MAAVTWLALTSRPPRLVEGVSDVALHAVAFTVLTFLLSMAHFERRPLGSAFLMLLYGSAIELLQGGMGERSAEWKDLAVDVVGIGLGLLLLHVAGDAIDRVLQTVLRAIHLEK